MGTYGVTLTRTIEVPNDSSGATTLITATVDFEIFVLACQLASFTASTISSFTQYIAQPTQT